MRERPIPFRGPMVSALLADRKTRTVSKPAPLHHDADHDTQGGGCLGAARFLILWAAFVAGVAVGVLVSWAWRCM